MTAPSASHPSRRTQRRVLDAPETDDQADRQQADGRGDQPMPVLVEDPADHLVSGNANIWWP